MSSEDLAYLADMRDSARLAMSYAMGLTQEAFERDQRTQDAIVYRLGVIGEAARFVSAETQAEIPLQWGVSLLERRVQCTD